MIMEKYYNYRNPIDINEAIVIASEKNKLISSKMSCSGFINLAHNN